MIMGNQSRKALWRRFLQLGTAPPEVTKWRPVNGDALEMQTPLTAQNIESRHSSSIASELNRSRSSTLIERSVVSRTLGRLVGPRFVGWRLGVLHFGIWVSIVFVLNLTATIWASLATRKDRGVLFEGECVFTKRLNTGLHVLINLLSAILLAGSNYTMQCMSSPTRQEIDRSHALSRFLPLQIGIPGIRNLTKIGRHRAILWCLLGASSLPLHLFYNSAIFSSLSSNSYWAISTSESFITDSSCLNCPEITGEFPSVLHRLWNNASTGTLERLDPAECIARYATSIQSAQRNVLLVASDDQVLPPNENPLINGSHAYGRWKFSAMSAMARDTARNSFDWICSGMDTKRPCSLGIDAIRDSSAESWLMGPGAGWPVKYCLSERADPTCKLHFEPTIGTIVTILNFVKAGVMFYVAFLVRDEPLMTMGDAVASFLERPDPTSKNRCLWAFANQRMFRDGKGIKHHGVGPQRWTCPQYRWKDATSPERRVVTIFMFLLALSVVTAFLAVGITALPPGITISQLDFVGLDPSSAIDMRNFPDSLVLKVVLANLPQLVFSLLYFSYNATLTAMLMSYEWVSYANKRKGLRVSHQPKGAQRCTYFLQLPYRFSIPLLLLSALLHWLVSQSLFLMSIDFYDSLGRPGDNDPYNSRFFGYQTVGFSPPAIIAVLVCGGLMTISIVVLGHIPYRRGMPVAGSSSMAISAACHLTTAEDEANEGTASSEKLQWGVVARADNGPGHCAFSPRLVEAPVKGRVYAGSFNPGL